MGVRININHAAINKKLKQAALVKAQQMKHRVRCPHCGGMVSISVGSHPCPLCGKAIRITISQT